VVPHGAVAWQGWRCRNHGGVGIQQSHLELEPDRSEEWGAQRSRAVAPWAYVAGLGLLFL
jgi:hypothetical protein